MTAPAPADKGREQEEEEDADKAKAGRAAREDQVWADQVRAPGGTVYVRSAAQQPLIPQGRLALK